MTTWSRTDEERFGEMVERMHTCLDLELSVLVLTDPDLRPRWFDMDPDWEWLLLYSYGPA